MASRNEKELTAKERREAHAAAEANKNSKNAKRSNAKNTNDGSTRGPKKKSKKRLIILIVEVVLLLLVLGALFAWFWFNKSADNIVHVNPIEPLKETVNEDIEEDTAEVLQGYMDVAIFGVDNRSNGNTETGNSDVIMIASINKDTKDIRLVSVYRDTFLDTDTGLDSSPNFHKVNRAYMRGGAEQAVKVLNANLDLDIEHFVTVDFKAVTDLVDAVGGVEIDVDKSEYKWMGEYIRGTAEVTGESAAMISGTGLQTLNGTQATAYCRIRYTKGNDYARTERQREVINEVFKKLKKSDLGTINKIVETVFPEISTDFTNMEILELALDIMNYNLSDTAGFPFNKIAKSLGGSKGDCVIACDLLSNVKALHKFLYDNENYIPSNTVKNYDELINSTYGITVDMGDDKDNFTQGNLATDKNSEETAAE